MSETDLPYQKHNNFFQSAMSNKLVAKEFFERHLPEIIKDRLDLSTLKPRKESYIEHELRSSQVDILYEVKFKNDKNLGNKSYLYVLLEHQSTVDKMMAFRLLQYQVRIMDDHEKNIKGTKILPIVYPLVFYHGKVKYYGPRDFFELFGDNKDLARTIFYEPFTLIDVNTLADDELHKHLYSGTVEFIYKHIRQREIFNVIEQIISKLRQLESDKNSGNLLNSILEYVILDCNSDDQAKIIGFLKKELKQEAREKMGTIAQQLKEEGKLEGKLEGIKQVALKMLQKNIAFDEIAEFTGLSINNLKKLKTKSSENKKH